MIPFEKFFENFQKHDMDELRIVLKKMGNRRVVFSNDRHISPMVKEQGSPHRKPTGLWYSLGSEWLDLLGEHADTGYGMFRWFTEYNSAHYLDLDHLNILRLNTSNKIDEFTKKYGIKNNSMINWQSVANDYKGIDIIPYSPHARKYGWYRGWDISSGCIWDTSAIKKSVKIYESNI